MNIVNKIFENCDPASPALIYQDHLISYDQLSKSVNLVSRYLQETFSPLSKERILRIGLSCPNGVDHIILAMGILKAGACLVPVASELSPIEKETLTKTTALDAIVLSSRSEWKHPFPVIKQFHVDNAGFSVTIPSPGEKAPWNENDFTALNPAFIRFSSGTTGRSKGVLLSHETLLARVTSANLRLKITPQDRIVWTLPMAHHFAVSIVLYLLNGATTIIEDSHLGNDVLHVARKHQGTIIYGSPFHHAMLAADESGLDWPTLRLAVSTAAKLPLVTAESFHHRYGIPLSQGYGIIEVGLPFLNTADPFSKPESVGKCTFDFEVKICDETGQAGEATGEIYLRGPGMLDAYLSPWQLQKDILVNGWFKTGDLGCIDADGFLYLEGRSHSVINVGGMKCFPEEIEAVLISHPDVRAARVHAQEHPKFGAIPVADIVPEENSSLSSGVLSNYCRTRLARYKIPVEFRFVETIPLTASGKILRSIKNSPMPI